MCEFFTVILKESESIQHSRATRNILTDGEIILITLVHHGITDPSPMLVYSLEEQVTIREPQTDMLLYSSRPSAHCYPAHEPD